MSDEADAVPAEIMRLRKKTIVGLIEECAALRAANADLKARHAVTEKDAAMWAERADALRAENARLREALEGMVAEWEKMTRYGSPLAKAANENLRRDQ